MGNSSFITFLIYIQLFFILLYARPLFSASIDVLRPISFGNIIASPSGDVIGIDAKFGPDEELSVLTEGNTIVKGGYSGLVRVTSDMAGQSINITYPTSFSLTADGFPDQIVDGIDFCSKTSALSTMEGEEIDFDIGGRLHIGSGQSDNAFYYGTMVIEVEIINP